MENAKSPRVFIEDIFDIFDDSLILDGVNDEELFDLAEEFKNLNFDSNGFWEICKDINNELERLDANGDEYGK